MAISGNIPNAVTAIIDENDNITVSATVQILDGVSVIAEKVVSITVFLHTQSVYNYALNQMVEAINVFKALAIKQSNINTLTENFKTDLEALL